MNINLQLYGSQLSLTTKDGLKYFFDPVRKKHIRLQPEEMVRQLWMLYLNNEQGYAYSSMAVEKQLIVGPELKRRYDLVLHKKGEPVVLFEFKRFSVPLSSDTCQQIAQYNLTMKIPYLVMSNGHTHYTYKVNYQTKTIKRLTEWPIV